MLPDAPTALACPRCSTSALARGGGPGMLRCARCQGTFIPGDVALPFVRDDVGVSPELLPELALELGSGLGAGRKPCARCAEPMRALPLKGVEVDWCARCGGLWLDAGELSRLSRGRYREASGTSGTSGMGELSETSETGRTPPAPASAAALFAPMDEALPGRAVASGTQQLAAFFGGARVLQIEQEHRMGEVLLGFELANRYRIQIPGQGSGFALENTSGLLALLARLFLRSHRPLDVDVHDPRGMPTLSLTRPAFLFFSDLRVESHDGALLGHVQRRFAFFRRRYDLVDARGRVFARIDSPLWRPWTFAVVDAQGVERAVITKRWSGFLREAFTNADAFTVDLGEHPWSEAQRAVIFAAALSIDLDFFERPNRH